MPVKDGALRKVYNAEQLEDFVDGYIDCALYFEPLPEAGEDEHWEPGETYEEYGFDRESFTPASRKMIRHLCERFLEDAAYLIPGNRIDPMDSEYSQAGHDLALTTRGYGDGFAEGRWLEPAGSELRRLSGQIRNIQFEPVGDRVEVLGLPDELKTGG